MQINFNTKIDILSTKYTNLLNNMSSTQEIVKMLKDLMKSNEELTTKIESLSDQHKVLHAKFDLLKNLDAEYHENVAKAKTTDKLTKPTFFKKIFNDDREKYLNTLYTQDEIDAIYATEEVMKKKKPEEKSLKAGALIYAKHIKGNSPEGRQSAFESIYSQVYP